MVRCCLVYFCKENLILFLLHSTVLLITPPFTQLNTPYPATAYLKGFLNTKGITSTQVDMGIEVILAILNKVELTRLMKVSCNEYTKWSANAQLILDNRTRYSNTIDAVIQFLQAKDATLATLICNRKLLPEASRFMQVEQSIASFGTLGMQDKAKHIATLYLEDIGDYITECVDAHFGFSRYAEQLARSANTFDVLYQALKQPYTYIDELMLANLAHKLMTIQPKLVALTVPFPGNVYSALRIGQWIKQNNPSIKVALGGGFANTELRSISDHSILEMVDYISLDDGELPIEKIIAHCISNSATETLKRTFALHNNTLTYINNQDCADYKQHSIGTPDYTGLLLHNYINVIEITNPMHKLWSDGRWNKLTMAHGCYWGKCTFCDVSLPYIKDYEPNAASLIVDRIEEIIAQTGTTGFHFVDEAAPPSLMKQVAIEIIKRQLVVSWWTNVRFEKSFTQALCHVLAASGCIAVSGGLEVASDRLLRLIDKGITVPQVAKVTSHFTHAGIMVHSYLMYGYPTQTVQETIDSHEMVRQLMAAGTIQSGFWHRFALTTHSPIGMAPQLYGIQAHQAAHITFANNDVAFTDATGIDHDAYSHGLSKSMLNYMNQLHYDKPIQYWYQTKVPKTTIAPDYIQQCLTSREYAPTKPTAQVMWLGNAPRLTISTQHKKGMQRNIATLTCSNGAKVCSITVPAEQGTWLATLLNNVHISNKLNWHYQQVMQDYEQAGLQDFELFWDNKPVIKLRDIGLVIL